MMPEAATLHATCIALGETGVLITGPPGSGKSQLGLQMIDQPGYGAGTDMLCARLVSDDQVMLEARGGALWAAPVPQLAGLIEVYGLGIVRTGACAGPVQVRLHVQLAGDERPQRLPDFNTSRSQFHGISLPRLVMSARWPGTPARLRAAAGQVVAGAL